MYRKNHVIYIVPGIIYHISHVSLISNLHFMISWDVLDYIHLVASVLARGWDLCRTGNALARYLTICSRYVHTNLHEWYSKCSCTSRSYGMCMCGVKQTAVLLQSRHHESVYVVLADDKRITSYIISICIYIYYIWWYNTGAHQAIPPIHLPQQTPDASPCVPYKIINVPVQFTHTVQQQI